MPRILSQNYPLYDKPPQPKIAYLGTVLGPSHFRATATDRMDMLTHLEKDSLKRCEGCSRSHALV